MNLLFEAMLRVETDDYVCRHFKEAKRD